jgi:hypothetical protein
MLEIRILSQELHYKSIIYVKNLACGSPSITYSRIEVSYAFLDFQCLPETSGPRRGRQFWGIHP